MRYVLTLYGEIRGVSESATQPFLRYDSNFFHCEQSGTLREDVISLFLHTIQKRSIYSKHDHEGGSANGVYQWYQ